MKKLSLVEDLKFNITNFLIDQKMDKMFLKYIKHAL